MLGAAPLQHAAGAPRGSRAGECYSAAPCGAAALGRPAALPLPPSATPPLCHCVPATLPPNCLPLPSPLPQVGGIVIVHAKQQYFLLEDAQEMLVGAGLCNRWVLAAEVGRPSSR